MRLYILLFLLVSTHCIGQRSDYYSNNIWKSNLTVRVGISQNVGINSSVITPQVSLSIRTPLHLFLSEPELVVKGESATCIMPPTLQPAGSKPGENFEQLSFSGASVQLNFPAVVRFGGFRWLLGPSVQIPFVHVTLRTRIKSFSNDPMYVADWQAKIKPFFSIYTAFQYDVNRYSLKISASKMTSLSYWGTDSGNYYLNNPINLGASLGYRF